jgi:Ca-activated chloride channel family protein
VQEKVAQEAQIEAKDIIIAVDVSYSMQATDISPTRYAFAKETIEALLKLSIHDNMMLIAFTTNPLLLSPPTTDHTLISIALKTLNPSYILTKGTSLKNLFKKISTLQGGHKNLILITDGGEENDLPSLLVPLRQANVSLITLALGTQQGSTIATENTGLLKDKDGNLVISRINPLLQQLSNNVKGDYLTTASTSQESANQIYAQLVQNTKEHKRITKLQYSYQEWYALPLALAMVLFLFLHTRMIRYLIPIFLLFGVSLEASFLDEYYIHKAYTQYQNHAYEKTLNTVKNIEYPSLQSSLIQANSYYKQSRYKEAISVYKSIRSRSRKTKQQLYYNIANAYAQLGTYSKAQIYYTKALQLGNDDDTRHNLACVVLRKDKHTNLLGIAHPKSQGDTHKQSDTPTQEEKDNNSEDTPSSGTGGGGEKKSKKPSQKKEHTLLEDLSLQQKQPLSSKVYELINKGYIRETQPW